MLLPSTQTMSETQAKAPRGDNLLPRIVTRILTIVIVAVAMIWVVHRSSASLDNSVQPAGFSRGLLHGALMPMALPNLLIGHDVTIYAASNTGRSYKLGYTAGVNACGLIFFGFFFWRVNRIRRQLRAMNVAQQA